MVERGKRQADGEEIGDASPEFGWDCGHAASEGGMRRYKENYVDLTARRQRYCI